MLKLVSLQITLRLNSIVEIWLFSDNSDASRRRESRSKQKLQQNVTKRSQSQFLLRKCRVVMLESSVSRITTTNPTTLYFSPKNIISWFNFRAISSPDVLMTASIWCQHFVFHPNFSTILKWLWCNRYFHETNCLQKYSVCVSLSYADLKRTFK